MKKLDESMVKWIVSQRKKEVTNGEMAQIMDV